MTTTTLVPIMDPNRGFRTWHIKEIFTGTIVSATDGRYVPNKDDLVYSPVDGWLIVTDVNYTTGISEMIPDNIITSNGVDDKSDQLLGAGPGRISESYRLYLDTSVLPHTMAVDRRLKMYGTTVRTMKIIQGTIIDTGEVISRQYDQQGQLLGDGIPMELVLTESGTNQAIQTPKVGYCSKELPDGETVTAVFYDDLGKVVSTSILLVKNTSFIRQVNTTMKYITGIQLESPFLSEADERVLECPINIPVDAIPRFGVVHYSDGTKRTLPIDGTKFNLFGLQRFVSTILGQHQPMTLIYYLSPDEVAYGEVVGDVMHLSESYMATTINVDGAYSVKLFTYPIWIDDINGYRLEHFLYNLERDEYFQVTSLVEIAANSPAFLPLEYGVSQDITFAIDLSRVSDRFKNYRHLQSTRVTLLRNGVDADTSWSVTYDKTGEPFGIGLHANVEFVNSNLWRVNVGNGFGSMEAWLREVYDKVLALYDPTAENAPPIPTHFKLSVAGFEMEYPVSMWNEDFVVDRILEMGDNAYLHFFKRTPTTDLQLGVAGLTLKQIV